MENWSSELFWGFYYVQGLIWMTTMVFLVQQVEFKKAVWQKIWEAEGENK